jgi:hypothetical protein
MLREWYDGLGLLHVCENDRLNTEYFGDNVMRSGISLMKFFRGGVKGPAADATDAPQL